MHKSQKGGNEDDVDYRMAETVMESIDSELNEKGYGCRDAGSSDEDEDGLKQISPIPFDIGDDQSQFFMHACIGLRFFHCFFEDDIAVSRSRYGALDHHDIRVAPDVDHLETLDRHFLRPHVARHFLSLQGPSRCCVITYGTAVSEELMRTVTSRRARELVPLYDACVAFSDRDPGDVHEITRLKRSSGTSLPVS